MQQERASKKQQELFNFVDGFIKEAGYGPSYREIMRALGYKSVSTVAIHIDNLIAKGYLVRRDNSARSLEVAGKNDSADGAEKDDTKLIENELIRRLRSVELTQQQRAAARDIFITLDLKTVADSLSETTDA